MLDAINEFVDLVSCWRVERAIGLKAAFEKPRAVPQLVTKESHLIMYQTTHILSQYALNTKSINLNPFFKMLKGFWGFGVLGFWSCGGACEFRSA